MVYDKWFMISYTIVGHVFKAFSPDLVRFAHEKKNMTPKNLLLNSNQSRLYQDTPELNGGTRNLFNGWRQLYDNRQNG